MASMNNCWLGFSLSSKQPHHYHHQDHSQNSVSELGFNSNEQVSDECFDLTSDSTIPSLNNLPPTPFAIFEAFSRNPHQSQGWNMKDASTNSFSCSTHNTQQNQETPKLEDFLGHSFTDNIQEQDNGINSYNIYQESVAISNTEGIMNGNSNMGLSMIKDWLGNHPAPPHAADNKVDNEAAPPHCPVAGAQTLSLSMSTGSQSSDNKLQQQCGTGVDSQNSGGAIESVPRKSVDTFGQRTSIYRGVTRHRWTGRYEAHLWDNSCRREGQTRKGRQVYLGGYDKEEKAARAYDLAALKYWGTTTTTNFPVSNYEKELEEMKHMTRQEYVASLRRKSSGFSRGASIYRGVTRHHQHGRWQARIGRVAGNKDLYLGTFSTQEEAAEAYDIAAIKFRGLNAVTNFEISRYDVKSILESSTLPIGGAAKRIKNAENAEMDLQLRRAAEGSLSLQLTDEHTNGYGNGNSGPGWPTIAFQAQPLSIYPYAHRRLWGKQEQDSEFNDIQHQLQLGNGHSFLQPSMLHNLMSLDSSSMEQSLTSTPVVYGNGTNGSSFVVPMVGRVIVEDGNQNQTNGFVGNDEEKAFGYEGMFGSGDAYQQARNLYYQSSSNGIAKASHYNDHGSTCNNWIPSGAPTFAAVRDNTMAVGHGASTFTYSVERHVKSKDTQRFDTSY